MSDWNGSGMLLESPLSLIARERLIAFQGMLLLL
jgi:hypothetical protein